MTTFKIVFTFDVFFSAETTMHCKVTCILYKKPQGLGASEKEKKIEKYYIILQGGELTCSHFFKSSC